MMTRYLYTKSLLEGKMKGLILASILLCTPAAALELRYIDVNAVFEGTAEGKVKLKEIKGDYAAKHGEIKGRALKFQARMDELKKTYTTLSDEDKRKAYEEVEAENKALEELSDKYWKEFDALRKKAFNEFKPKFSEVLGIIVKAKKIDTVLDKSLLVYFSPKMDLTDEVIKAYDKKHPVLVEKVTE
jgi:Skp family chaperone for outer membrane proteins